MASRDETGFGAQFGNRPGAWHAGGTFPGGLARLKETVSRPTREGGAIGVSSMHALSHIEGVYPVGVDPALPRPFVGIVGALHGNERCGLAVVEGLRDPEHPIRRALRFGTLVLIHGNPEATRVCRRHTPDGADLNRLFDFSFAHTMPRHAWGSEHYRALALRPVIESLDAVLDLHSATAATEPFAIVQGPFVPLAARLGCACVTFGWDRPAILSRNMLCSPVSNRYQPAVAVECGQHEDPAAIETAFEVTERFLEVLGMIPPLKTHRDAARTRTIEVAFRVAKPNPAFQFTRPFAGFDRVRKGEILGRGGGVDLVASDDFVVLLPNDGVAVGEDLLFLGKERQILDGVSSDWPDSRSDRDVA